MTNERADWVNCLQERARVLAELPDRERRHLEVIESAQARTGLPLTTLELAYELALEEGLDPALALEVLVCKIAVVELSEPVSEEAHSLAPPEWVSPVVPVGVPEETVVLERHMRKTFRRLRHMLELHQELSAAVDAFGREPDVAAFDYQLSLQG